MYPVPREFKSGADLVREARAVRERLWPVPVMRVVPLPIAEPVPEPIAPLTPPPNPLARSVAILPPVIVQPNGFRPACAIKIREMVRRHYGLTVAEFIGRGGQRRSCAWPRFVGMYLCVRHAGTSFKRAATTFGRNDHTSALHGKRRVEELMKTDPALAATIAEFVRQIEEWSVEPRAEAGG